MTAIMAQSPNASQRSWRSRKCEPFPYWSRAVTAEALKTMSAPIRHRASVVPNIHRSVWIGRGMCFPENLSRGESGRVFFFKFTDELLEDASAVLVIFKLVEARAGGRQQHGVAGLRAPRGCLHGARQRPRALHGDDAAKLRFDLVRRAADEQRQARMAAQRLAQNLVVAAF